MFLFPVFFSALVSTSCCEPAPNTTNITNACCSAYNYVVRTRHMTQLPDCHAKTHSGSASTCIGGIGVMSGMMGLSFFLHSFLLQMCAKHRKSSEPAIVKRDLGLAYFAACLMYVVIGATPAVVFELGSRIFANPASYHKIFCSCTSNLQWPLSSAALLSRRRSSSCTRFW